jgi:hypothetical protein
VTNGSLQGVLREQSKKAPMTAPATVPNHKPLSSAAFCEFRYRYPVRVWQKAIWRDILRSSQPLLPGDENPPPPRFEHGSPDEPKEPGFHGKPIASSLLRQSPLAMHQDGGLIFTAHSTWQKNKSVPYSRLLE